jgi:hypothetical protein
MKYIITESRLDKVVTEYLNELFPLYDVHYTNPNEYDDETGEEYDDDTRVEFYLGDYDEDEYIFKWYDTEYFNKGAEIRKRCPLVHLDEQYSTSLNGFFGDKWIEPFKVWFTSNFNLPVKTVEWV